MGTKRRSAGTLPRSGDYPKQCSDSRLTNDARVVRWPVLRLMPKWILVLALSGSIGLHWAFLQSVAWAGMLAGNLQGTALSEAFTRTFDGQHPCFLCKAIAACKKTEKKAELSFQVKKLEFLNQIQNPLPHAPARFLVLRPSNAAAVARILIPPSPPPRLFLG